MRLATIIAVALALASPATAFDAITYPTSAPATELAVHDSGFDWNGFYAGVYGVGQFGGDADAAAGLGIDLGVNARFEFYLLGAEVAVQGLSGDDTLVNADIVGRAGVVISDNVVAYAAAGYGLDLDAEANGEFLIGAGVEVAVSDDVSLRGQYMLSMPTDGGDTNSQFSLGANFHF